MTRDVWCNKEICSSEAEVGAEALHRLNDYMEDPYTRQSILDCGVVPYLSPVLKLVALQHNSNFAQFQLSVLSTLTYIFIFAAGRSQKPVEVSIFRFPVPCALYTRSPW